MKAEQKFKDKKSEKDVKGKIGLEVHVYIVTNEKLFCRCRASREKGLKENVNVCPVCVGMPGAKPMLPNGTALGKAIKIALMLNCKVNSEIVWMRKHYNWPDLPKGYQNTMSGSYAFPVGSDGSFSGIGIDGIHLEEDPSSWDPKTGCVDYNRSGLPLAEIVTKPDFKTPDEVVLWLKKLLHSLSYLKAADKNAGIKADVNVSIPGKTERVEIKNVNSIENIRNAIIFELKRHREEKVVRETRRFDESKGKTFRMRAKEEQDDYRFIEDPDLQKVFLEKKFVGSLKRELPESPDVKLKKVIRKYNIGKKDAEVLTKNLEIVEFFEEVAQKIDGKFALPWVTIELLRVLNWNRKGFDEVDVKAEHFVKLLDLVKKGRVTELQAKQILNKFVPRSFDPSKVEGKITDKNELKKIAENVIRENKKAVEDYSSGDKKALNFLMGEIMKKTERRADFKIARDVLEEILQ